MTPDNRQRHGAVPLPGEVLEVRPGIFWARLALPFRLNHVNVYLFDDDGGWTVFDTGIGNALSEEAWGQLLGGAMAGRPVRRVICSHHHPDHIGMVGWLSRRFDAAVLMTEAEFLVAQYYASHPGATDGDAFRRLYISNGLDPVTADAVLKDGHGYQRLITPLPECFTRIADGGVVRIGGRLFEVLTGGGHTSDQAMLLCREEGVFLSADQVLPRITPNISVTAMEPAGDPLGTYLASLGRIARSVPADALTLPGHDRPFEGVHDRMEAIARHHHERCDLIAAACRNRPATVDDLVPVLFPQELDLHQRSFAFTETLSHVNFMIGAGRLAWADQGRCGGPIRRPARAASKEVDEGDANAAASGPRPSADHRRRDVSQPHRDVADDAGIQPRRRTHR